jgi:hypothetical protein
MPDIVVQPSTITASWSANDMDLVTNQIYIINHPFITGDSVVFTGTVNSETSLQLDAYYWVNKIDNQTIDLYETYEDAVNGWSTPVPASATIFAINGNVLSMTNSDFVTGSRVKLVDSTGQFYYYWVGRVSLVPLQSTNIALYNSLEDALADINRVTSTASVGNPILNAQMTDDTRVVFDDANSGTLSVTAIVRAYTNERPVREIKVTMKFDRTSYGYDPLDRNAIARIEESYKPTVDMFGFKTGDYTQLMTGTKYPDVNLIDPAFVYGQTYTILPSDITVADNTINLAPLSDFFDPVQMLFIETPVGSVYSTTFGL